METQKKGGGKVMELNEAQKVHQKSCIEAVVRFDKTAHSCFIQDAIEHIASSINTDGLIWSIKYAADAVRDQGGNELANNLLEVAESVRNYESLFQAVKNKDQTAIAYFEKQTSFRIV